MGGWYLAALRWRAPVLAGAILILSASLLQAQSEPGRKGADAVQPIRPAVHRLTLPIILDGVVDEPAWQDVTPVPLFQYGPRVAGPLSERTELRLAYDDDYF